MTKADKRGNLYVLSAPSGAGKTTISAALRQSGRVVVSVSHTTRAARRSETDGGSYFFVNREEFAKLRDAGEFLEWAEVYGNLYGTSGDWVDAQLSAGKDVLLEIDHQGAMRVKKARPQAVLLFVAPPSMEALRRRLQVRAEDGEETIERRMRAAEHEMSMQNDFDYVIINDNLNKAVARITKIIADIAANTDKENC